MRKTSFKLLSASLAVAMTMSSMPYNVLAASPEQTFAQAVQQAQTTEADGFETAAPAEENLVTADAESTEKVTYTVTPGVSYGKGSIKLISGVTESTGDDGEKVYTAEKDSTITFEAVPEDGWALDSVMYMSASFTTPDLKITKVDGKDNQYTCTIPDDAYAYGSVGTFMIYVQFAPVLEEGQYEIKQTGEYLSVDKYGAKPGETVKITSTSDSSTRNYVPTVADEDGTGIDTTLESTVIDEDENKIVQVYTFVMPEKKVTITEKSNRYCAITLETNDDSKFASHVSYSSRQMMSGNMNVVADSIIDGKYYKHTVTVTGTQGNTTVKSGELSSLASGKATYTVAKKFPVAVTLRVDFVETDAYNITNQSANIEGADFTVSNGELAAEGDTVTLLLSTNTADGYYYDGTTLPKVTDADGNEVTVTADAGNTTSSAKFTFTMPEKGVTTSFDSSAITQKELKAVTVADEAKSYIALDKTEAREGENVTITLTDEAKKVLFIKVIKEDGSVEYIRNSATSFTMPAGAVTVSVIAPDNWFEEGRYDTDVYAATSSTLIVSDAADLAAVGKLMRDNPSTLTDKTVNIVKDIDMSAYTWVPMTYTNYNNTVTFNGNGHTIKGLNVEGMTGTTSSSWVYSSAFIAQIGSFTDVTINDLTFEGTQKVHTVAGTFCYLGGIAYGGGSYNKVVNNMNVTIDGATGGTVLHYPITNSATQIVNSAVTGKTTLENVNLTGYYSYYGLSDRAVNSYDISEITMGENANPANVSYYGVDATLQAKDKTANCYTGTTLNNFPENAKIYGITKTVTGDNQDAINQNFSYITPVTAEGYENDNLMSVDSTTNKVGRIALVTYLNSWVDENQTEDNKYCKWETDKTTGRPVLKAAEETVVSQKYAITSNVTGSEYGETTVDEEAAEGSKVTVYTAPKSFCKVKSISVETADGKKVDVTDNGDGSYSFTMPKSAVTVSTEYAQDSYAITAETNGEGTVSVLTAETKSSDKAKSGETVTVTVTPDRLKYYTMDSVTVTTASGKTVEATTTEAINGTNAHEYTFTMPEEAVTVTANFKDVSSYYNEDGSLKEGTYKMQAVFGSTYYIDTDKIEGAMGYEEQYTDITVSVDAEGNVTVDDYEMPGVKSPIGYAGGGELWIKSTPTPDANDNGKIKGADDAGVVESSDYAEKYENYTKVYTISPTVTKTGKINPSTNVKTENTGDFYFTKVMQGSKQVGGFYNSENVESVTLDKLASSTSSKVAPFNLTFSGINYIKNDADYANQNVLFTTYITEMAYISEVLFRMDFSTIEKVGDTDQGEETTQALDVSVYTACEPGATKTPPANIDAIKSATLVTKADGSRQLVFDLGETIVFGLHGHMGSLRVYNADSMENAFKAISKNDTCGLKSAIYSDWYTDKINSEADSVAYDKTPVEVTDSRGYVYYTTDGTEFSATSTTTDLENALVYPGKAVVDVPDYFDLIDNNEIYLTGFIDGMSKDTNLKLKLTAKNEDNTPVVKTGTAHISQFGEYDVTVNVTVTDDVITDIEVTGANFAGTYAETNKMMLEKAVNGLKGSYINKSATDVKEITGVDAVSGATYSSNAIRDAILNALELKQEEEVINLPTEKLAEGEYSVDIAYYTDKVKHSLVENDKTKAKIVVDKDGSMTLVTDIINGTSKEPLYIYGFNGYYEGNDTSKSLKEAAVEMNDIQYSDDVFGEDEKVVTKVSFPLEGDFAAIYNTNADIYVPAMKNLNGLVSGIDFKQGRFSADCFVKVYWDSLTKTSSDNNKSDDTTKETTFGSAKTTLTAGTYSIPASLKNAGNVSQDSMAAGCIKSAQMTVAADGTAAVTVDLQSVSFAGLTAYASNWKIYQGTSADGKTVDAQYTTDEEGRVTQITFTLPDNSYDGVYVNMFVDAMNYSPDAYLALDYANAVKTAEPDPAPTPDPVVPDPDPTPEPTPTPDPTPEPTPTPTPDPSDNKIADGNYYVPIALWNAVSDKASMGNAAFEKNSSALITVKDGKVVKVQIAMNPVTVTSIYSAVTAFEVEGVTVTIDKTEKITTSAGNEVDAIRLVTFELPEGAQPSVADITYADVSFKVPDTPMGDTMMSARLRFDWSALTATNDTSLVPAEDQTEEKSPAVDVTDEKTGVHVSAAEGVLPAGSELKVTKVSAGTEYTKAANALADVGSSFELYEVHFEKDGQEVEPDGSVVVKYLIPAGMNADNVVLYRINDDGSKTLIKGSVENGYYVVTTKGFSYYALVEKASTDNGNKNNNNIDNNGNNSSNNNSGNAGTTDNGSAAGGNSNTAGGSANTADNSNSGVKTADSSAMGMWAAAFFASLSAAGLAIFKRKKRPEEKED